VRGEHIQHNASELRSRLEAALANDVAASPAQVPGFAGNRLVAGAGVAAGLALFAAIGWGIAALDVLTPGAEDEFAVTAADSRSMVAMPEVSRDGGAFAGKPAQVTAIQYVVHHAGYSSGLSRTLMQSGLIAPPEDEAGSAPEAIPIE
jgi:hypothetical protein